ncbi:response regulator [Spirosoma sp. KUDC1026]|uniref:response regulator n=1 Tax=Spirosoma sp. KUDC1026 TaxID=2745947 RepID=UPI00159B859A|nr:response regulator transcription factor [Spirosoma sp. KUDC1026]QKZ13121.1 response regulator transcription factor [Spirosoma sp. KUDC1026]
MQPVPLPIRILIIDDHRLFNDGLRLMLNEAPDIEVVGQIYYSREAMKQITELRPDVLVIDFNMPELDGLALTRQITAEFADQGILILSMYGEQRYIDDFKRAGALGYMLKTATRSELLTAIRAVAIRQPYFDPKLSDLKQYANHTDDVFLRKHRLTPREVDIIRLLKEGFTSIQIAERLNLSAHTIDTHRKNIHAKLGISTIAELVRFAIEAGI